MRRTGRERFLVPHDKMDAHLNRRGIYRQKSGIAIQCEKLRTRFAIEPHEIPACGHRLPRGPVQHRVRKSMARKPARHRQSVDVERFTGDCVRPEDRVFIVQIHAGTKFSAHAAGDQFPRASNACQFLA